MSNEMLVMLPSLKPAPCLLAQPPPRSSFLLLLLPVLRALLSREVHLLLIRSHCRGDPRQETEGQGRAGKARQGKAGERGKKEAGEPPPRQRW